MPLRRISPPAAAARPRRRSPAAIALIEVVLSLADAGFIADPSLRGRVFVAGAFWASLLHGDAPLYAAQPVTMFVSHALLHGSLLHMAMNMTILLALGRFTADRYGPGAVLPVFLLGAIAGGAVFGLLADRRLPDGRRLGGGLRASSGSGSPGTGGGTAPPALSTGPVVRRVLVLAVPERRALVRPVGRPRLGGAPRRLPRRARLRRLVRGPDRPRRPRAPTRPSPARSDDAWRVASRLPRTRAACATARKTIARGGQHEDDRLGACSPDGAAAGGGAVQRRSATPAPTFFGDSLSDPGNRYAASGGTTPPSPPYFAGPLLERSGLGRALAAGFEARGLDTANFAFGGATAVRERRQTDPLSRSRTCPTSSRASRSSAERPRPAPGGHALVRRQRHHRRDRARRPTPESVAAAAVGAATAVADGIATLRGLGVRDVVVLNLPSLDTVPLFTSAPPEAAALAGCGSDLFNDTLDGLIDGMKGKSGITQIDIDATFADLIAEPAEVRRRERDDALHHLGVSICCPERGRPARLLRPAAPEPRHPRRDRRHSSAPRPRRCRCPRRRCCCCRDWRRSGSPPAAAVRGGSPAREAARRCRRRARSPAWRAAWRRSAMTGPRCPARRSRSRRAGRAGSPRPACS